MAEQTVRLSVDGWSNPRFAKTQDSLVMFEVMSLGCACSTCIARLDAVKNRMIESDVMWGIATCQIPEREDMGPSAVLVVEPEEMPERLDTFLSDLLGLQIRETA